MNPSAGAAWAEADVADLARFALGDRPEFTVELRLRPRSEVVPLIEHRSARDQYGLLLDPLGALHFRTRKPRQWMLAQQLRAFPTRAFTAVLDLCPLRGDAETTLFSYAVPEAGTVLALREQRAGGLTLDIAGEQVSFEVFLDYAQWQRLAVTWDSVTGQARLYQDDNPARVTAEATGKPLPPLDFPVSTRTAARGAELPPGGSLVVGQYQGAPGVLGEFDLRRGLRGSVSEVDLWADGDGPANRPQWTSRPSPGAVGRWRFTAGGLAVGETPGSSGAASPAHLGGFGPGELRDVRAYRVVAVLGNRAWTSRSALPVGGTHRIEMRGTGGDPELLVDGAPLALDPLDPRDLRCFDAPRFRIGPVQDVTRVRLDRGGEKAHEFVTADRCGDRLRSRSGSPDLGVEQ